MQCRDERFWAKVNKDGPVNMERPELGPCWIWLAAVWKETGYGAFQWATGITKRAHTAAYELSVGSVPAGMVLDHLCRVRNCVNPRHLEPKANAANILDSLSQCPTRINRDKTHCKYGHPLEGDNLWIDAKHGKRKCKTCRRKEGRDYDQRRYATRVANGDFKRSRDRRAAKAC